ncbi:MAG: Hsp20/alpha crystallin family protein [Deltaproteobacteria bacterium]|nr:Hsp20/alpha crystallin family protein [Deltaproteobacteria bacterium]
MMSSEKNKEIAMRDKEEIKKEEGELTRAGVFYSPQVDIHETSETITLLADLPGVDKSDLDIDIKDQRLTITGRVKEPEERFNPVYSEYGIGGYSRSFQLGDSIDPRQISASLKDGVLTLALPKADRLKPRKVEIAT